MLGTGDFVEIQQLLARYCHVVDGKDWDRLPLVFAADAAVTVVGIHPRTTGLDALRQLYSVTMRHPLAHHSTSLIVVDSSDGAVELASKWVTVRADGTTGTGVYEDVVVRTPDGWRIRERVARPSPGPARI
jgi:ketosteroid isomerase-like protein